ncbi:hypothetical protein B0A49_07887 [Cryomyces minteri]|uniref:Cullin family profile domain-containing protein n=1 Tax=Cryomyces minteri TaxID=331657 RepID=A0A4U0XDM7_9PEZI|nr:hypothetical protein B0A49_07887 [Cryomyces minteri]
MALHNFQGLNNGDEVDFESTWETLAASFTQIHTKNASLLSFEQLYRQAYKIVLKKKGDELYKRVASFEQDWLTEKILAKLKGLLSNALISGNSAETGGQTANERLAAGDRFLRELKTAWEEHQLCMSMLTDVLMYMDRVYCTDHRQPSIYNTAMALFRDCVLLSRITTSEEQWVTMLGVLRNIILEQIKMERDGDIIDKHAIKACIYMLEGLEAKDTSNGPEKLYSSAFEEDFIRTSHDFYKAEGETLLRESDAGTYCRHTKKRIDEELDRCRSTLSDSTTSKIERVVEDELIRNRMNDLIEMDSGVKHMVDNERLSDLGLIFDLNARVDSKKTDLTKAVQRIVVAMGTAINNAGAAASQTQPAPAPETDGDKAKTTVAGVANLLTVAAIKWVEDVLELKDKFDNVWSTSFRSDQALQTALTRSFAEFINAFARSSENISLFIDDNMKKGIKGKTEYEIDVVLEKAITLLRYIQDKDMFDRYYKRHLTKRLLMGKSLSTDVEKQMVSRMKIELGNNFTLKMESMFKDMTLSEELTAGYKEHVTKRGDPDPRRVDLDIKVLTSMTWPLEGMGASSESDEDARMKTIYPPAIERLKMGFEKYYSEKHSGRKLTWLANMGTADIRATFPKVPSKNGTIVRKHELNVSTYGMIVLLLFNDLPSGESLNFEDVQSRTNIPTNELIRTLQSVAVSPKTRILVKEPMSKDVKPTDRFSFNESFESKFAKIKVLSITSGNKVEGDRERKETEKKNNESRNHNIEAAVVRIMKQRKELSHQQLVSETLTQLASQFKPDVVMIKKRIESLIEREYLDHIDGGDSLRPLGPPAVRIESP